MNKLDLIKRRLKNIKRYLKIKFFILKGKKPWSKGYFEWKWKKIGEAIKVNGLVKLLAEGLPLPDKYGVGLDERIIEFPWVLANLPDGSANLLDAGSALNFRELLENKKLSSKKITIVTLTPESNCFWKRGIAYVFEDIRKLPFLDNSFDLITCISTLEHVGMDNSAIYTKDEKHNEHRGQDYLGAILELKRILKPGGRLFITVPFGKYENHGFFQQFNSEMLDKLGKTFVARESKIDFYRYSKNGWQLSAREECLDEKYFDIHKNKNIESDGAAAARAVACLILTK